MGDLLGREHGLFVRGITHVEIRMTWGGSGSAELQVLAGRRLAEWPLARGAAAKRLGSMYAIGHKYLISLILSMSENGTLSATATFGPIPEQVVRSATPPTCRGSDRVFAAASVAADVALSESGWLRRPASPG